MKRRDRKTEGKGFKPSSVERYLQTLQQEEAGISLLVRKSPRKNGGFDDRWETDKWIMMKKRQEVCVEKCSTERL